MGLISDQGNPYDARRHRNGGDRRYNGPGYDQADGYGQPDGYGQADGYGRGQQPGHYGGPAGFGDGSRDGFGGTAGHASGGPDGYAFRETEGYSPGRHGGGVRRRRVAGRRGRYGMRGRMSVPVVSVVAVVASIAVVAAAIGADRLLSASNAAADAPAVNTNCTLIVPANPLTAQGLATPYQLTATDPANGPCNEANANQTAFVQGAVIDPATGQVSAYDPLVVDAGTQPATAPVVPTLPAGAVVAVWFGFNGQTLSLAGPDQVTVTPSSAAAAPKQPAAAPTVTSPSVTPSGSQTPSAGGTPTASATPSASTSATAAQTTSATASQAPASQATPTPTAAAAAAAASTGAPASPAAAVQAEGSAPLSPNSSAYARYSATLTKLNAPTRGGNSGAGRHHRPSPSASASMSAAPTMAAPPMSAPPMSAPPMSAGDTPAASGQPDATLRQANCVAGEDISGQFSSFTQVGACNAVAFFAAANTAIRAGKLHVPSPGTASDGMRCLTTRSFALIDQDQSDNVTTEYLASANGQTAQDTAANRQALAGASTLVNGSDNGLLDLFVDPALGCSPWEVPNLADGGAPTSALPLDEIQAARYARSRGNPAALVPLNDPMTLDNSGNFSTDKTNTYRSLVDMPPLPAGESPRAYCVDMERIQGSRLQQDVNLLTQNAGPAPGAANTLFTFLAMRLQQSFVNLNCGSFGLRNDVSTTVDASGIVVEACFLHQVAPVTAGPGNPMAGTRECPATTASSPPGATPSAAGSASANPTPSSTPSASSWRRHHGWHHHWWW